MGHACGSSAVRADQEPARGTQSATQLGQRTEYERYSHEKDMVAPLYEVLFAGIHQIHEKLLKPASGELVTAASQLFVGDDRDQMNVYATRASRRIAGLLNGRLAVLEDMTPEGGSAGCSRGTAGRAAHPAGL